MKQTFEKMGEDVRDEGWKQNQPEGGMTDLVFNPETGEFETKQRSPVDDPDNMIVTEMTREGFAALPHD